MNPNIRKYSYDVFIELGTLHIGVKFSCKVGTIWETNMKNIQASSKPDLINGMAYLSDTLFNSFVFEFDMSSNLFTSKPSTLKILLYTEKGVREAGQTEFDLSTVLNKRLTQMTMELPLQKCPDKKAKVSFTIKTIMKQQIKNHQIQPTFTSGLMPDIVMGVKQNPSNNVNAPISDVFKKKVKIQQPPSSSNVKFQIPSVPSLKISPPGLKQEQNDNSKGERDALMSQNANISANLQRVKGENENLRSQLRRSLQQKQDLFAQIQSYNNQMMNIRSQNQDLKRVQEMYKEAHQELIRARTQLAKIFNAATQLGGAALTDRLQSAVGISQRQM